MHAPLQQFLSGMKNEGRRRFAIAFSLSPFFATILFVLNFCKSFWDMRFCRANSQAGSRREGDKGRLPGFSRKMAEGTNRKTADSFRHELNVCMRRWQAGGGGEGSVEADRAQFYAVFCSDISSLRPLFSPFFFFALTGLASRFSGRESSQFESRSLQIKTERKHVRRTEASELDKQRELSTSTRIHTLALSHIGHN